MNLALICAATLMINLSSEPWTTRDLEVVKMAQKRCYQVYKLPCVSKFTKTKPQSYNVICGKAK